MKWNEYNAAVSASNESARADSHHRAGPEPPETENKKPNRTRNNKITVYLSDAELSRLNAMVDKTIMNREQFIHPFKNHPFKVVDDVLMQETVDSIMQFGVLNPTIIRPDPGGGYEMVAGHRRLHASGLAGKDTIPAIVRNLTDDEAVILLVDTNLQRENISPMERAQAYKMKMEALKHQGQRTDLTLVQVGPKLNSAEKIAQDSGESVSQVKRLIRLTELVPEIQQKVDAKEIALNPAVELSYLKPEEQRQFLDAMEYSQNTPSLSQAQRLKKLSREGKCTQDAMYKVMSEEKKDELDRVTLKSDTLRKYFPKNYTPQQMEQVIIKLLDQWQKKRQRQNER